MNDKKAKELTRIQNANMAVIVWAQNTIKVLQAENELLSQMKKETGRKAA